MGLSNMYTQQAAEAAHRRKMAEVQGDSNLASIEQGRYDEAMARALDAKFQEDRKSIEDAARAAREADRYAAEKEREDARLRSELERENMFRWAQQQEDIREAELDAWWAQASEAEREAYNNRIRKEKELKAKREQLRREAEEAARAERAAKEQAEREERDRREKEAAAAVGMTLQEYRAAREAEKAEERAKIKRKEKTKALIIVIGIWVAIAGFLVLSW